MIWLLAPACFLSFVAGMYVMGLLRASAKPTPEPDEHLHDEYGCNDCSAMYLRGAYSVAGDGATSPRGRAR